MTDTHCHLTYDGLHERAADVIAAAHAAGVDRMISVGTTPDDALAAVKLAERHAGVFAAAGLHPHYVAGAEKHAVVTHLSILLGHPKVVALGEMGLDRHYPEPPLDPQREAFAWQLELLAQTPGVPAIIHNREATDETLAMIAAHGLPGSRFVFHCFTGSAAELDAILATGAMVSITGIATFKNSRDLADATDRIPLDRLMVETDSPFLTPEPFRKVRPNEPRFVPHVAAFLAQRRGMSAAEFTAAVDANADRFFGLSKVEARPA